MRRTPAQQRESRDCRHTNSPHHSADSPPTMSHKRKDDRCPKKLTAFFLQPAPRTDLEDRSGCNNIKCHGVPEFIPPTELQAYATSLFSALIPELTPTELTIDRIHKIPKPRHLENSIPRDILMRIHFYQAKELILSKSRAITILAAPYNGIQIYADLSQHTLQMRRQLKTVTKALNNQKLTCK